MKRSAAALAALLLCGCAAPYASVKHRAPSRERCIRSPEALDGAIAAAADAWRELEHTPKDKTARDDYNNAVARVISALDAQNLAPWRAPVTLRGGRGFTRLAYRHAADELKSPAEYEFIPADTYDVKGRYFRQQAQKDGLGAPLVAQARRARRPRDRELASPRDYYGVTAVLRFRGRTAELELLDPLEVESVHLGGRSFPLAADFSVPLALAIRAADPARLEAIRLLRPDRFADTARLIRLQPYDPRKTVLLLIHGLKDSAATWTPLVNRLRADADFRRRYQIWLYSYPTGYPYGYSASVLRRRLDMALKQTPLRQPMVVAGHSMGGNIARLLVTDTGDKLWTGIFGRTPAATRLPERTKRTLAESLIFERRREIGRVIFLGAPLRGADYSLNLVGRLGSSLVQTPRRLLEVAADAASIATFQPGELRLRRAPNAIDTLAPNHRYTRAISAIPLAAGVPVHVIAGDRGRGGSITPGPGPVMSDGIVPYWSSHLPQAASEKIVPSDHSVHQHPEAMAEVARILRAHASHR